MDRQRHPLAAPVTAGMAAALMPVVAPAQPYPDRFAINVGTNEVYQSQTEFAARSSRGVVGTTIDFRRDLDGDETSSDAWLGGYYRFTPRHRIDFGWLGVDREGRRTIGRELDFGDRTFVADTTVRSEIESSFASLAYTWSFHHTDDVELGVTLGATLVEYSVALEGPNRREEEDVSGPLPTLGYRIDYAITPRWHLKAASDAFYFSDDEYDGSFDSTTFALEWWAARNVTVGLGLERRSVDATIDGDDWRGGLSDFYRSVRLYAGVRF